MAIVLEQLLNTSMEKRIVEHFFREVQIQMEEGEDTIRLPYIGKLIKRKKNGLNNRG